MRIMGTAAGGADSPGEQAVAQSLAAALDDTFTLFRGVRLPQAVDAIDAVLTGAFGILVITVYEYEGTYACDGDRWFHSLSGSQIALAGLQSSGPDADCGPLGTSNCDLLSLDGGQSWQPSLENPVQQALHDQDQLRAYLDRVGLQEVSVETAVMFPNARTRVASKNPAARLLRLLEIPPYARELTGQAPLTPAQVKGVVTALERTVTAPAPPPAPRPPVEPPLRRAGRSSLAWLIALGILLACNGGICFGFALVWLLKNPL